tara:strand:+ start:158 stop:415 length:258 start_codon:yes stop_codon:yes gene_type:complete
MDTTYLASVLTVEIEVVILTHGLQVVTLSLKDVVSSLAEWVETLEWATTLVHHTELTVGIVTVTITMMRYLQVLRLLELSVLVTV